MTIVCICWLNYRNWIVIQGMQNIKFAGGFIVIQICMGVKIGR